MRLGTRGSALALTQARQVAELLGGAEVVVIRTSGDVLSSEAPEPDRTDAGALPTAVEDKSRWVDALEQALLAGEIDLAVHSAKDVPGDLAEGLALLGAPARADVEDVLCGVASLEKLPAGARIGTGSVRRAAQLLAVRDDVEVVPVSGNVDTRLRKLGEGACDALVLARAGLQRLGREREAGAILDPTRFIPSPGQGALALESRAGDIETQAAVEAITDRDTLACLLAERAVARALGASCNTPLGAWAKPAGCGCLELRAWVGLPDGSAWVGDGLLGGFYEPEELGRRVAGRMVAAGADDLLRQLVT